MGAKVTHGSLCDPQRKREVPHFVRDDDTLERRDLLLHRHQCPDWDLGEEFAGGFLRQSNAAV